MKKIVCFLLAVALVFSNVNVSYANDYKLVEDDTIKEEREFSFDDFSSSYYYTRLSPKYKELYNDIYLLLNDYFNGESSCTKLKASKKKSYYVLDACLNKSKNLKESDYINIYLLVCYENPKFFFAEPTVYTIEDKPTKYAFGVMKNFNTKKKMKEGKEAVEKRLKDYIKVINSDVKLKTANDLSYYIAQRVYKNIPYDWAAVLFEGDDTMTSQSIYSALVDKTTVCAGYSKLYSALMNYYGIETISVLSKLHAWNMVRIGDEWYVVDLTEATDCGDFYFMANSKQLKKYDKNMLDNTKAHVPTGFYSSKIPELSTKKYKNTYQFVEEKPTYKLSWPNEDETVLTITAKDNAKIYYSIDNGSMQEYKDALTFSNKESHHIIMTAKGTNTLRSHEVTLHIGK